MSPDPFVSYAQNQEDVVLVGALFAPTTAGLEDVQNVRAT
jgi:hypothetical protein